MTQVDLTRQVGDVLARLHDPVALRKHPLAARPGGVAALRSDMTGAIDGLRPAPEVDPASRAWRPYHLMRLRYIEGLDAAEVARQLAISRSQYYREHESALTAVASLLRERGWTDPVARGGPALGETRPPARRMRGRWLAAGGTFAAALATIVVVRAATLSSPVSAPSAVPVPKVTLGVYAGDGQSGHVNGPALGARFAGQFGLAVDANGSVYVADTGNNRIRRISTSGLVLDLAGSGIAGYADGPAAEAQFSSPNAVTVGPDGTVYVGDAGNLRVRAISPSGVVSTLAGSGQTGYADGIGTAARFSTTGAIISGRDGTIYLPDPGNNVVRKITPTGIVSTYAGTGHRGHVDGPASVAEFNVPMRGGGVDALGNVFVLDTGDNRIRKISPDGTVSTVAGTGVPGFLDGPAAEARFSTDILGVTTDPAGTLFVMDAGNHRVRKVTPDGTVSTLFEFTDTDKSPGNIKVDQSGNLYLSDRPHNVIYKLAISKTPPR